MTATGKIAAALGLVLVTGLGACGGASVEDQLSEVESSLREARQGVLDAREALDKQEEALAAAMQERDSAQEALSEAEGRLREVESRVDLEMTDGLLFRVLQGRLLEDERLADVAIRAEVQRGGVILYGDVPDEATHEAALEVVREVPGVASVESKIQVRSAPAEPPS